MSHRLKPGAPAGFHPDAAAFDRAFVEALEAHDWTALGHLPHRAVAAEDVVTSTRNAQATVDGPRNDEVLAYEAPWGVGYTEAVLFDTDPALYAVARRAVRELLRGERVETTRAGSGAPGVFVTLRKDGSLRGCVGHVDARPGEDLHAALADVAIAAALRDPRFDPVTLAEVADLTFEVSLLSDARPLTDRAAHDVRARGLVVEAGRRRGLLLPDVETIDSIEDQERVCRRKAGIAPGEPARLSWFTVEKIEPPV
jgi:AmmeMemoRadiSam system protein A